MSSFLLILFTILTIISVFFLRKKYIVNPLLFYLIFNWIIGVGCFSFFDLNNTADQTHATIILISPILFLIGHLFAIGNINFEEIYVGFWNKNIEFLSKKQNNVILALFIVAIIFSLLYYQLIGYNLMWLTLTSNVDDFISMRLNAYAGEKYFAPGIFNQFKNTIFPILFIYFYYINRKKHWIKFYLIGVGSILLYCLLGTGQRTFLITSAVIIFFILFALKRGQINKKVLLLGGMAIFILFTILSFYLKRSEDVSIISGIEALIYRIFDSNQYASVVGFRYIYSLDTQYGYEWWQSFTGLIPGIKGSDISNRVFAIIFGGTRGTAPLSVWGSAYHNFGFLGCIVLGFFIGFIYTKIYIRFLYGKFNVLRVCVYGGMFAYLAMWVAGSPAQLLNNGLIGCIFILLILKLLRINETNNPRPQSR